MSFQNIPNKSKKATAGIIRVSILTFLIIALALPVMAQNRTITLRWTATGDDGLVGRATLYDIRYSTSVLNDQNWASARQVTGEPIPLSAGHVQSMQVGGLYNDSSYFFAMKVADEAANWSGISNIYVASEGGLDVIGDLSATEGTNSGEINIIWTAPSLPAGSWTYQVKANSSMITEANWSSIPLIGNSPPTVATGGARQQMTISGLVPGTLYYIAIRVSSGDQLTPLSNIPSAIAHFTVTTGTETEPTQLSPPSGGIVETTRPILVVSNGDETGNTFFFEVSTESSFSTIVESSGPIEQQEGSTTAWQLTERLEAEQVYFWRFRVNSGGFSASWTFVVEPKTFAYPNPFQPAVHDHLTFTDVPSDSHLILATSSGDVVREWVGDGQDIIWDGFNASGNPCSSGVYMWYLNDSSTKGKLIIVR